MTFSKLLSRTSLGLLCCVLMHSASAHGGIVTPGSVVEGKTIAEWTGDFWNWVTKEPFATNPAADPTGAFANLNQSGPVFFVAGTFGSPDTFMRTFTVPTDKYLLVPMINYVFWAPEDGADEAAIRQLAKDNVDAFDELVFELDGVALANPFDFRETSPPGGFTLFDAPLLQEIGLIPMDRLAVSDGYWVMLEPLSAGPHTIHLRSVRAGEVLNDVFAHVTAVPEPASLMVFSSLLCGLGFARSRRRRT